MTQFQQKAQLRLQEMEVEWRRTLFERFRTICREEMMEVMKALLESMHSPEGLEKKLEEFQQSAHTNQMELFSMATQNSEELKSLAQKLDSQPAGTDPAMLEAISKQVVTKQEEGTRQLQEDVRQSAQLSRKTLWKAVAITAAISLLLCIGVVASLKLLSGSALVSQQDLKARDLATKAKAALDGEIQTLQAQKDAAQKAIQDLTTRRDAMQADIRQLTESQKSVAASLSTINQQMTQLQQVQEQFRFKLIKGETGGVFVEIPADAQPFEYMNKTFIQVK